MSDLEIDTNRQGNDISNFQIDDATACSRALTTNDRVMTFVKHPDRGGGVCWLKDSVAPMSPARGMIAAVKRSGS